jgi:hypothetical protein
VTSSTLPVIVYGQMLSIAGSSGGFNFRLEYVLFVVLIGLFLIRQKQIRLRTPLDAPILAFMIIQCFSVAVALVRGYPLLIGPVVRLVEGYAFYFLASRLTSRDQIPSLVRGMITIAVIVAAAIVITTITGSQYLYTHLFSASPDEVSQTPWFDQFFGGYETPRVGYGAGMGDLLLPSALAISLVMIALRKRWRVAYIGVILLVSMRALVSGQRFWIVHIAVAVLVPIALLTLSKKGMGPRVRLRWLVSLGVITFILVCLFSLGEWATKLEWLRIRSADTLEQLTGPNQIYGIQLAWAQLTRDPAAFLTGFGCYWQITGVDVNLGLLVTICRYGLGGVVVLLWLLRASVIQGMKLLKMPLLRPMERGLVCAVLVFVGLQFFGGFIRGMAFNENGTQLIPFSIMLGWIQVIWLKVTPSRKVGDVH